MTATNAVPVDSSNIEQLRAWDGDEGEYWADHAEYFDRSVAAYHERLLAVAAIGERDRVLDVGCGTGQTTRDAARAASAGSALGVDLSSRMLDYARRRATDEGRDQRDVRAGRRADPSLRPGAYDVAISRTAAMFFGDHVAAFTNIGSALRPGGRLVLVTWQPLPGNEWIREISGALAAGTRPAAPPDAPGPSPSPTPDRIRALLTSAGFADVEVDGTTGRHVVRQRRRRRPPLRARPDGLDARGPRRRRPRPSHRRAPRHDGRARDARRCALRVGGLDHASDPPVTIAEHVALTGFRHVDRDPNAAALIAALDE